MMKTFVLAAWICSAMLVAQAADAVITTPTPVVEDTLIYKTVDGRSLRIDWTRPRDWKSTDRRPAVVFFHGGGWVSGQPGQFAEHSKQLAAQGMVCLRAQYRLLDKKQNEPPITCTEDASDAFRFIRSQPERFGIDPQRIAAGGGSAGGHLAAFLGMMDDPQPTDVTKPVVSRKPNAMLLFNPVYNNGPGGWGTKRVGDAYRRFSPAHNITTDDPPAIVFLGTKDNLIPVATGESFRDQMQAKGIESRLFLYEGQGHGFFNAGRSENRYFQETMTEVEKFLEHLGWLPVGSK